MVENKSCVVTGAGGLLGSHIVDRLSDRGADIVALVHSGTTDDRPGVRVVTGDIRDESSVRELFADVGEAPLVFHCAVNTSSWQPATEIVSTNTLGTINLLEVVRQKAQDAQVDVVGTAKEYQTDDAAGLHSTRDWNTMYALSKTASSDIAASYADRYDLDVTVIRNFNIFGTRESTDFITATVIGQALTDGHVKLGDLSASREFTYVGDCAEAHIELARRTRGGEAFDVRTNRPIRIRAWVEKILAVGEEAGYWSGVTYTSTDDGTDDEVCRVDEREPHTIRVDGEPVWQPTTDHTDALKETIEWYSNCPEQWAL